MNSAISNVNVTRITPLITPHELKKQIPTNDAINQLIIGYRQQIINLIHGHDPRWMVIIGPCSIHDAESALEYATNLRRIAKSVEDRILILMRVYFEKPRTSTGWRGMIFDPLLNNSYEIEEGLKRARSLLIEIAKMGIATATEVLDPIVPQYIDDLLCWAAIGARTTESQTHRELASGLSMPVGFKNNTDGNIMSAINAMLSSQTNRKFIGIDQSGRSCVVETKGNNNTHLILRGGTRGTNYQQQHIVEACTQLKQHALPPKIIVDCSHANSEKRHDKQKNIYQSIFQQRIQQGNEAIMGAMVESNLFPGRQEIETNLKYGVSITDACIGWQESQEILQWSYSQLKG